MEQNHRTLINNNLSDLINVTHDVECITDLLLERNVINKWMKRHILVIIHFSIHLAFINSYFFTPILFFLIFIL